MYKAHRAPVYRHFDTENYRKNVKTAVNKNLLKTTKINRKLLSTQLMTTTVHLIHSRSSH